MDIYWKLKRSSSDVNIIIGENGAGKSIILNDLASDYLSNGDTVIAIATSVHDKFTSRSRKFHFHGGRHGRGMVEKAIKKSLIGDDFSEVDRMKYLISALEYSNYSPEIGVKVEGFKPEKIEELFKLANSDERIYDVINLVKKYEESFVRQSVVAISLWSVTRGNNNVSGSALSALIRYESILKKHKIIRSLKTYLFRDGYEIALTNASSGELMIISMLVHISSNIDHESIILIDEPENSLHPRWQRKYVEMILDLFYLFQPKIFIASHSPQIIPIEADTCKIFTPVNGEIFEVDLNSSNNEELLSEVFGVVTPENRFLSDKMIKTINDYDSKEIGYNEAVGVLNKYMERVSDPRQKEFLNGINDIILKMEKTGSYNA